MDFATSYIDDEWDRFASPLDLDDSSSTPNPFLFGWLGSSRLLGEFLFKGEYDWSPQGNFLLFQRQGGQGEVLVAYSRDNSRSLHRLWSGEPVDVFDFLGNRVDVKYSEADGTVPITFGALPIFVQGFPARRVETVHSLKRIGGSLSAWPRQQSLHYELTNRTEKQVEFLLELEAPADTAVGGAAATADWVLGPRTRRRVLAPAERWVVSWGISLPTRSPVLRDYLVRLRLRFASNGKVYRYRHEDHVRLESDVVTLDFTPSLPAARKLNFRVKNLASGVALKLNLFYQVFPETGAEIRRMWKSWSLPLAGERELSIPLPFPAGDLDGRRIRVGYQVRGRQDFATFEFRVRRDGELLRVLAARGPPV